MKMKKAFTMLELVFVIVVIGIIAAVMIKNVQSSASSEAATKLTSHIRYTQHLAMVDDKIDPNDPNWFKNRWQIVFTSNSYSIRSENGAMLADDPSNNGSKLQNIDLNDDYGVSISLGGSCSSQTHISFDNVGRPIVGELSDDTSPYMSGELISSACTLTLSDGLESRTINIEPESGYIHIIN